MRNDGRYGFGELNMTQEMFNSMEHDDVALPRKNPAHHRVVELPQELEALLDRCKCILISGYWEREKDPTSGMISGAASREHNIYQLHLSDLPRPVTLYICERDNSWNSCPDTSLYCADSKIEVLFASGMDECGSHDQATAQAVREMNDAHEGSEVSLLRIDGPFDEGFGYSVKEAVEPVFTELIADLGLTDTTPQQLLTALLYSAIDGHVLEPFFEGCYDCEPQSDYTYEKEEDRPNPIIRSVAAMHWLPEPVASKPAAKPPKALLAAAAAAAPAAAAAAVEQACDMGSALGKRKASTDGER
jgi:hypothetical protein